MKKEKALKLKLKKFTVSDLNESMSKIMGGTGSTNYPSCLGCVTVPITECKTCHKTQYNTTCKGGTNSDTRQDFQ